MVQPVIKVKIIKKHPLEILQDGMHQLHHTLITFLPYNRVSPSLLIISFCFNPSACLLLCPFLWVWPVFLYFWLLFCTSPAPCFFRLPPPSSHFLQLLYTSLHLCHFFTHCPLTNPAFLLHFQNAILIVWPVNLEIKTNAQNVITDTLSVITNVATIIALTATLMRLMSTNAQYVQIKKLVTPVQMVFIL